MVRAILESLAFRVFQIYHVMLEEAEFPIGRIRLCAYCKSAIVRTGPYSFFSLPSWSLLSSVISFGWSLLSRFYSTTTNLKTVDRV